MALGEPRPYPKAAQVPPKRKRKTSASPQRISEIRAKKATECRLCRTTEGVNAHHMIPRSLGGIWTENNIVGLCGSGTTGCHGAIERREPDMLRLLRLYLTDAEEAYIRTKAGEAFLDRYYPVRYERG